MTGQARSCTSTGGRYWRAAFAVLGPGSYWLLRRPDWSNPLLFLYDVPTLCVCCSWLGSLAGRVLGRALHPGDAARLALIPVVMFLVTGVEYCGWPLSGHLLCATIVAVLEAGDSTNPSWLRIIALAPVVLLISIRTFWPQSALMAMHANTVRGLLLGAALESGSLLVIRTEVERRWREL